MASSSQPRVQTYLCDAALTANTFVKIGTDGSHVAAAGANEKAIGVAMAATSAAEDAVEVALVGGGARLKISETVAAGKYLTSTASGQGEVADAAGEHVAAYALESGVANDIIAVEVVCFEAAESDA